MLLTWDALKSCMIQAGVRDGTEIQSIHIDEGSTRLEIIHSRVWNENQQGSSVNYTASVRGTKVPF